MADEAFDQIRTNLKSETFLLDQDADMRLPRAFGRFKHLTGLVCKEYDKDIHVIEPFEIPTDWPVLSMCDVHPSVEQAIAFYALSPRGEWYAIDEVFAHMNAEAVSDAIIRRKRTKGWRMSKALIDPLSKGDAAYHRNHSGVVDDTFTVVKRKLTGEGIILEVASKDRESGVQRIKDLLMGQNRMPSLWFFKNCERHIWEISRWVYDENGSANAPSMHMMENLYRAVISGLRYVPPQNISGAIDKPEVSVF